MAKQLALCLLVAFAALSPARAGADEKPVCSSWDDDYAEAVQSATTGLSPTEAELVKHLFDSSRWNWKPNADYVWARGRVKDLGSEGVDMVRLESGNANTGSYEVVWIVRTPIGPELVSNLRGKRESRRISAESWDKFIAELRRLNAWALDSAANTAVDDGTAHFFSLNVDNRAAQFAIYGMPNSDSPAPGERAFVKMTREHQAMLGALLALAASSEVE